MNVLTPDRAREIISQQSQFPYWGNYQKFMSPEETAEVRGIFETAQDGNITFAGIVHRRARADVFNYPPMFDELDAEIARARLKEWNAIEGARVGDWLDMLDGTSRRFTHNWGDGLQTTCGARISGSFYFYGCSMSFSGSLDPTIPRAAIVDTGDTREGEAWFFHHNSAGASRGVYFTVPCRVFRQVKL